MPRGRRCRALEHEPLAALHLHLGEHEVKWDMPNGLDELLVVLDLVWLAVNIPIKTLQL